MKKLILIIFLYPFVSFSQWINFAPGSAGSMGSLIIVAKNIYYYRAWNNVKAINTLYFTKDGGKTWIEKTNVWHPAFINDSTGFGDLFFKKRGFWNIIKLGRTFDYASTWPDSFNIMPDSITYEEVAILGENVVITYQKEFNLTLLISSLGEKILKVCDKSLFNIHFINDSIGYGLDKKNFGIYKTTNGGTSWNLVNTISGNWPWSAFQFTSEDTAYALLQSSNMILKSTNGGISWDTLKIQTQNLSDIEFYNSNVGFAVSPDQPKRLFLTKDGGNNWAFLGEEFPIYNLHDINCIYDKDSVYLFLSFPGGGVTNLYKGSFALKDILSGIPEKTELIRSNYTCYPNPTSGIITLKCNGEIPCMGKLYIMNLHGQTLLSQYIHNQENEIDICGLSKGVYFVKVVDENGVWVEKVMKE